MNEITKSAKEEMRELNTRQRQLYDKHVYSELVKGTDEETIAKAYQDYIEELNGFDSLAFDKVVDSILNDDQDTLDYFTTGFRYIPEYIGERSRWDNKVDELLSDDTPLHMRRDTMYAMDTVRKRAHDGVIRLFNDINDYAEKNKLAAPYPKSYSHFDIDNHNHRADVAEILTQHTTVLEGVGQLVEEKYVEVTGSKETTADKFRNMSMGELMKYVNENSKENETIDELSDLTADKAIL